MSTPFIKIGGVKLDKHKGITEEIVITEFGKINVFCGKNNSGKSSVLEAINQDNNRILGINLLDLFNLEYFKDAAKLTNKESPNENKLKQHADLCQRLTKEFAEKRRVQFLYPNNYSVHLKEYYEYFIHRQVDWDFSPPIEEEVLKYANNMFKQLAIQSNFLLLPPKRKIQTHIATNLQKEAEPTGSWVITNLYKLKNQPVSDVYKIYEEVLSNFKTISDGWEFEMQVDDKNILDLHFIGNYSTSGWNIASDCGLGLQELLAILFFTVHDIYKFISIEEPENHMHPEMQRRLLAYLSNVKDKQFFIATHSNVFLDRTYVDKIYHTKYDGKVSVEDATSQAELLSDLGYQVADNLLSDLIVLVEGPHDSPVYIEFLKKMDIYDKYNIKFWPLGGNIMSKQDLEVFSDRYNVVAIIDLDPESKHIREKFEKKCEEAKIKCFRLERYSIENYFTLEALRKVFPGKIKEEITEIKLNKRLKDQIEFETKKNSRKIVREMSLSDIEGTDLHDILKKIEKILKEL